MFSFLKQRDTKQGQELLAYVSGDVIPIEEVKDGVFSEKLLGDGLAILPEDDVLCAPCDGEIAAVMKDTGHACGIRMKNGMEILLHIGLDTVEMQGEGFQTLVNEKDRVKTGQELIRFDREKIKAAGHRDVVVMVITNDGNAGNVTMLTGQNVQRGETKIMQVE